MMTIKEAILQALDDLKKSYFQAVSNSSRANYSYLVALEIGDNLKDEME